MLMLTRMSFAQVTTVLFVLSDHCGDAASTEAKAFGAANTMVIADHIKKSNLTFFVGDEEGSSSWSDNPFDSKCADALHVNCGAARHQGFMKCAMCVGVHQQEVERAGCEQAAIQDFCQNKTCATQLVDQCLEVHGSASTCSDCNACASKAPLCKAEPAQQEKFCQGACDTILTCHLKMLALCEADRQQGPMNCAMCSGRYQSEMQQAGCTSAMTQDFCSNTSCIPKLATACAPSYTHSPFTSTPHGTCVNCGICAQSHQAKTGCRAADTAAFCDLVAPPTTQAWPTCTAAMNELCGYTAGDMFACASCTGRYESVIYNPDNVGCTQQGG